MKLLEIFFSQSQELFTLEEEHLITVATRSILSANKEIDEKERTQKRAII